jgi:hypothetical protein
MNPEYENDPIARLEVKLPLTLKYQVQTILARPDIDITFASFVRLCALRLVRENKIPFDGDIYAGDMAPGPKVPEDKRK